jgi:hypothetical protein
MWPAHRRSRCARFVRKRSSAQFRRELFLYYEQGDRNFSAHDNMNNKSCREDCDRDAVAKSKLANKCSRYRRGTFRATLFEMYVEGPAVGGKTGLNDPGEPQQPKHHQQSHDAEHDPSGN